MATMGFNSEGLIDIEDILEIQPISRQILAKHIYKNICLIYENYGGYSAYYHIANNIMNSTNKIEQIGLNTVNNSTVSLEEAFILLIILNNAFVLKIEDTEELTNYFYKALNIEKYKKGFLKDFNHMI